jgi:dTDP-4-dehydrorhamnose reductase
MCVRIQPRHVLLRFGWLMDDSVDGLLIVFSRAAHDAPLLLVDDRRGNLTPADDAARVILAALNTAGLSDTLWGNLPLWRKTRRSPCW